MHDLDQRYAAAERLLLHHTRGSVVGGSPYVQFTGGEDTFQFRSVQGWLDVDPRAGTAFVAADLVAAPAPPPPAADPESVSPDGAWALQLEDHQLVLVDRHDGSRHFLTSDGSADVSYAQPPDATSLVVRLAPLGRQFPLITRWSADSRHFFTQRVSQTGVRMTHLVQAAPAGGGRPRHVAWRSALTGDEALPMWRLVAGDVQRKTVTTVDELGEVPVPFTTPLMGREHSWWHPDGSTFYVLTADREHRTVRLHAVDARGNTARLLVQESADTPVFLGAAFRPTVHTLSTGEVLWWSERSGWGHLYRYDGTGQLVRQLTDGPWVVRDICAVDEAARSAVVAVSGREPGIDPYHRQLYRLHLDTGDLIRLTDDALDHEAIGTPSGVFVVDSASDVATPGHVVVRNHEGGVVIDLGRADAAPLLEAGYQPPERFSVLAADGTTPLYGVLYHPHDREPGCSYPVLEDTYYNSRCAMASVRFPGSGGMTELQPLAASFAALGFAVVVLDSRGTALRSRAFREHGLGLGFDNGLADRAAALQQLADTRAWLDVTRAGVYGVSAGGYAAARALLRHPGVYRAAVAGSGSHDDRLSSPSWAEQVRGPYVTTDWEALSNTSLADSLHGKLLLVHGDVDDVVPPTVTLRLVDALMTADRDADLLFVPGGGHMVMVSNAYVVRRVWDYLVQHVGGWQPPNFQLAAFPPDHEVDQLVAMFS